MEERAAKLECKDDNDKCQEWAASGQCQANRVYMVSWPLTTLGCSMHWRRTAHSLA